MRARALALLVVALSAVSRPAIAEPLAAHETAAVLPKGRASIGIIDPLRYGLSDRVELVTHPLLALALAPNAVVRWAARRSRAVSLTGEYGLSVPTMPMRFAQGTLFPSWDQNGGHIGWTVVPQVGFVLSTGQRNVFSLRADTALGIFLDGRDAEAPHSFAPLELWLAPATRGARSRAGLAYDHALGEGFRLRGALDVYLLGPLANAPVSPLVYALSAGMDGRLSSRLRLRLGVVLYDIDAHRTVVEIGDDGFARRERARNRDVFPTADLILTFGR